MADGIQDARLRELAFLAKLERGSVSTSGAELHDPVFRSMLVHLLHEGHVNGLDTVSAGVGERTEPHVNFGGKSLLQLKFETRLWEQIGGVLAKQGTLL